MKTLAEARKLYDAVVAEIAETETAMAAMRADKPAVADKHSDGKRVRYVRHETRVAVLTHVLDIIDSIDRDGAR